MVKKIIRTVIMLLSIYSMTMSFALFYFCELGSDPLSVLVGGISTCVGISYGMASNLVNLSMFGILFFFGRKYVGVATVVAALFTGTLLDINTGILSVFFERNSVNNIILYSLPVFSTLLNTASIGCYIAVNLGTSPFDGNVLILHDKLKISYQKSLYIINTIFFLVGIVLKGTWGYATLVYLLLSGAMFDFFIIFFKNKMRKLCDEKEKG